jgi:hypothetical protein
MNIPVTSTPNPAHRRSTIMGCELVLPISASRGPKVRYAEVLSSRISHHGGVVFSAAGGLVFAEFEEAADAVNCAISIQEQFAQYNKLNLDEGSIDAKLGIHFGELFFAEGEYKGGGIEIVKVLLPGIPGGKVYMTADVYARVRVHLRLKLDAVRSKEFVSLLGGKEIFSVDWEAVTVNLEASLKRLGEDDLQRSTSLTSKLGIVPSKRASPIVMIFILLFLFILFKILKWL